MSLSTEKKIMELENRLVVAKGEGVGCWGAWAYQTQFRIDLQGDPAE